MSDSYFYSSMAGFASLIIGTCTISYFIAKHVIVGWWRRFHNWKDKQEIRNEMLMQQRYRNLYQEVLAEDVDQLAEAAAKEMRRQYRRSTR